MSEADRLKWDSRYAAGAHSDLSQPCGVLRQHMSLAPAGTALDVACGAGRNALFMARNGFTVDALDISTVGMSRGRQLAEAEHLPINWQQVDLLDSPQIPGLDYSLILMCHFIAPQLLAGLPRLLRSGGILLVEQHLLWTEQMGPLPEQLSGPGSARFRVEPGSLRAVVESSAPDMEVLVQEEGVVQQPGTKPAALARLVLRRA